MINKIKAFEAKYPKLYNLITRAFWTFLEVFLAVILEALIALPDSTTGMKATFIVAVSAGLSAIKTLILDYVRGKIDEKEDVGDA